MRRVAVIGGGPAGSAAGPHLARLVLEVDGWEAGWELPRAAWALGRGSLDTLLLAKAAQAGARIVQPATVRGVRYGRGGVEVILDRERVLTADVVVHADGSGR